MWAGWRRLFDLKISVWICDRGRTVFTCFINGMKRNKKSYYQHKLNWNHWLRGQALVQYVVVQSIYHFSCSCSNQLKLNLNSSWYGIEWFDLKYFLLTNFSLYQIIHHTLLCGLKIKSKIKNESKVSFVFKSNYYNWEYWWLWMYIFWK